MTYKLEMSFRAMANKLQVISFRVVIATAIICIAYVPISTYIFKVSQGTAQSICLIFLTIVLLEAVLCAVADHFTDKADQDAKIDKKE